MSDPRSAGTANPPPTLGGGYTSRYDIDALGDEDGAELPGVAEFWRCIQKSASETDETNAGDAPRKKPHGC